MKVERRFAGGEVEMHEKDGYFEINGYGAVFNSDSQRLFHPGVGDFVETIDERAFDKVMQDPYIMILANHDPNLVLGRTGSGTATIGVDSRGLWYQVKPPKTRADIMESIERGDVFGSSFGFEITADDWVEEGERSVPRRKILEVKRLFDLGPVTYPAYMDTSTHISENTERSYRAYLDHRKEEQRRAYSNLYEYRIRLRKNLITI